MQTKSMLYRKIHDIAFSITKLLPDRIYLRLLCIKANRRINLKDPKTFDDKLWWLKLYNRDPLLTVCSDKYAVRDYVRDKGLADILIKQFGVYETAESIDFKLFREEVILKCTSGSGKNYFYNPEKDEKNIPEIVKNLKKALKKNPYWLSREWNYKNIKSRIVAEAVLRDASGKCPLDYKFMCFDGKPRLLFLDIGLIDGNNEYNHNYPRNIYDMDFNLLPVWETRPNSTELIKKPENFERMVKIAETLSEPFPHCRVDLYNVDGKIFFGEITFYHGGGFNHIEPEAWALKMGSWIDLNSKKIKKKSKR